MTDLIIDWRSAPHHRELWAAIDEIRPGLAFLIWYALIIRMSSAYSNLGRGLLVVAPKSMGKGSIIRGTRVKGLGQDITADEIKRRWLTKYLQARRAAGKPVKDFQLSIEDIATFADNRKTLAHVVNLVSLLISDKEYSPKGHYDFDSEHPEPEPFVFRRVSVLMGSTNRLYEKLSGYDNWTSGATDRLTRVGIIYTKADIKLQDEIFDRDEQVPNDAIAKILQPFVPKKLESVKLDLPADELRAAYSALYGDQHTRTRGRQYLAADLKAIAALSGHREVRPSHLKLLRMMGPYLQVGNLPPEQSALVSHTPGMRTAGKLALDVGTHPVAVIDRALPLQSRTPQLLTVQHRASIGPRGAVIRHSPELKQSLLSLQSVLQREPA